MRTVIMSNFAFALPITPGLFWRHAASRFLLLTSDHTLQLELVALFLHSMFLS
jgi:hypothetical protein